MFKDQFINIALLLVLSFILIGFKADSKPWVADYKLKNVIAYDYPPAMAKKTKPRHKHPKPVKKIAQKPKEEGLYSQKALARELKESEDTIRAEYAGMTDEQLKETLERYECGHSWWCRNTAFITGKKYY